MRQPLTGYVLAGGKSSRMGREKALLELGGRPLAALAVETLSAVCDEVAILSGNQQLAAFAPLVPDRHPGCGPMGGMEAGLARARHDWCLFLAVDMPFVSRDFLAQWTLRVMPLEHARVALFTVEGVTQPALCLLHREVGIYLQQAMQRKEYKLLPALQRAGEGLAEKLDVPIEKVFLNLSLECIEAGEALVRPGLFINVNTPEEFTEAEARMQQMGKKADLL